MLTAGHVPLPLLLGMGWDVRLRICRASQETLVAGAGDGQVTASGAPPFTAIDIEVHSP